MGKVIDIILEIVVSLSFLWHIWHGEWDIAAVLLSFLVWCAIKKLIRKPVEVTIVFKLPETKKK